MAWNTLNNSHLIDNVSMASSITSAAQPCQFQDNIGIQLAWTGDAVGDFTVEVSVDHNPVTNTAGSWATLTLSSTIAAASVADNAYIEINQLSAPYIRVVFTRTSGTGVLNCHIAAKGV